MKVVLYPNFHKKNALCCARDVCDLLHDVSIDVSINDEFMSVFADKDFVKFEDINCSANTADIVIAIGGDGTILRCAKYLVGMQTKLLGINTGTLGFMAGLESNQLDKLRLLKTSEYEISNRMTIDVIIHNENSDHIFTALNEVSVRSKNFQMVTFEVFSDNYLIGKYRADGVIFSTPLGSTAYALSAGGPVIEPDLECIEMTLICPHSLFARATVFSSKKKLRMTNCKNTGDSLVISIDGEFNKQIGANEYIEIMRGRNDLHFVNLIGNSFHESLYRKMCKPI